MPGRGFAQGQPALLNLSCIGTEDKLGNCTFNRTSFDATCEIASVVCQGITVQCVLVSFTCLCFHHADPSTTTDAGCPENEIRLVNDSRSIDLLDGRVEVCINRAWGTVCSEGFNIDDARVVCESFNGSGGCVANL